MIGPIPDVVLAAHNAAYAIPELLVDEDLIEAIGAHWGSFGAYPSPGEWFDRFRELLSEAKRRGLVLQK